MSIKGATLLIPSKIQAMLKDYAEDLEQAWTKAGEDPLTISFSAKIGVAKGKNICEVSISFTKEKVKDSVTFEWSTQQGKLFETIQGIDDRLKKDGTSMIISLPSGKSVTLGNNLKEEVQQGLEEESLLANLPDADEKGYMLPRGNK